MDPLIECVPNFSEGRDKGIIREITDAIEGVEGAQLLHVDAGVSANRTVITFMGNPEVAVEAAFAAIKTAARTIDMRQHHGTHPRIGAVDVFPLVPYAGISMQETVSNARNLAMRVGQELLIPVYCYANAALHSDRQNLAVIRSGEYEGLAEKMLDPRWIPDFGPNTFNAKSGATVIGARDFLIAYNVNLDTTSVRIADEIARDVRESGRVYRHPKSREIVRDAQGKPVRIPGSLKGVKAIGWYIEEFGCSQVSMNLTDIVATPIHIAYEEVRAKAKAYGVQVTGSELIGMIPLHAMLAAGLYSSEQYHTTANRSTPELVRTAIDYLGLDILAPFDPQTRIIELALEKWRKYPPTQFQTSAG